MKFALVIVASLIATVAGQPAFQQFQTTGLRNLGGGYSYRATGLSGLSGFTGLGGSLQYGLGYGTYGLGTGYGLGYGLGYGRTVALAAPAHTVGYLAAAPALGLAAAPAVQTVGLAAAPAVQTVALQAAAAPAVAVQAAAPALQTYAAAPAVAAHTTQYTGPIHAAIESHRTVEVVDAPVSQEAPVANHVVIGPNTQPINLEFQTQASPLAATQNHVPTAPAETQHASYEEQPDLLRQDIIKPVVQDVHETIVPFRRITQELKPVQESVHQVLPRGQERGFYQQQSVAVHQAAGGAHTGGALVGLQAQAAPAAVAVQAAPALQTVAVQAAPAVSALRVAAAPATFALQAVPAASASYGLVGVRPAASYGLTYGTTGLTGLTGLSGLSGATYGLPVTTGLTTGGLTGGYYGSSYTLPSTTGSYSSYSSYSTGNLPLRQK